MLRIFVIFLFSIVVFIGLGAALLDVRYGGGDLFTDRTSTPTLDEDALQLVANLDYPPGNIAVTSDERIFFTFHPEGSPAYNVAELVDGQPQALAFTSDTGTALETVLSLRVDQQNRLWLLDYANHGTGQPKIVAIDLNSMKVVHEHKFSSDIAGIGSHLNDFQVDARGQFIYIADASIFGKTPAVIVYDIGSKEARRVIEDHDSVDADHYIPVVEGEKMLMLGFFAVRPGVDSIALDRRNEWLYFAPVSDDYMHRVRVSDLNNLQLDAATLTSKIERFALKTMSDGITMDDQDRLYISDLEHSAITVLKPDGQLTTLYKNPKLRWPDGFSFGPNGDLYVTASALQDVMLKPASYIAQQGPYQIYKLSTQATATPGH